MKPKRYVASNSELVSEDYSWRVISFIPHDVLYSDQDNRRLFTIIILVIFGFILLLASWFAVKVNIVRKARTVELHSSAVKYRRIAEELAESDSLRELLLDIITHDLKNPASAIFGLSEMAREDMPEYELIESIYQGRERLLAYYQTQLF